MRVCIVEDKAVTDLEPLTLTRPAFELILGASSLEDKIAQTFGCDRSPVLRGSIVRPQLAAVLRERDPNAAINDRDWLGCGPVLVVNGRWVPPGNFQAPDIRSPQVGLCCGHPACAWVGPGQAIALDLLDVDSWFDEVASKVKCFEIGGEWITRPWDLVAKNADHLARDFATGGRVGQNYPHRQNLALVGPAERLLIHAEARIDPYTVFDTTGGPITIESGVWVQSFTRVEGPCYIGRDTHLFRANLRGGVTIGSNCRIGGEVEASIVHGYSNKYHDGFLGHAYVGAWVNLGAITSNSDLRNDYGEVTVPLHGDPIATGQAKVGCFIGDHTRTGIGSMLNTGTSIGVMCNVLPAGPLLPKHVPSFAAVLHGRVAPGFPLAQMFATAQIVKGRRGQAFTPREEQLYRDLYEQTRLERERAFQRVRENRNNHWLSMRSARLWTGGQSSQMASPN